MKLTKKLSLVVSTITSAFLSSAVITGTYIPAAQAEDYFNNNPDIDPTLDPNYFVDPANIVINPSFEQNPLVNVEYDPTRTNPLITGWINDSKYVEFENIYSTSVENFPHTGFRDVHFGYNPRESSFPNLSQILNTVVGQKYDLSFYLASAEEAPRLDNEFQVFVGGNKLFDQKNLTLDPFEAYKRYDLNFLATSTVTELKFAAKVGHDWLSLDDVNVKPSLNSVPEPSVVGGTFVTGLLGVWLKKRRLSRKNA